MTDLSGWPPTSRQHAPDHLVALIASVAPMPPPGPTGEPLPSQWASQIRRVADEIWSTAWTAGAVHTAGETSAGVRLEIPPGSPLEAAIVAAAERTGRRRATPPASPTTST